MNKRALSCSILATILVLSLACNLPAMLSKAPAPAPLDQGVTVTPGEAAAPGANGNQVPASSGSATPPPLIATIMASTHVATPSNIVAAGAINYDVDSSGTGPEHRAPYGDSYNINLFERPFTQTVMNYLPELDIVTFRLTQDTDWYYISVDMTGGDMNDPIGINYGVELDTDHDGFGDYLIWANPPYTQTWLAETVQVFQDTNHDSGGASAEKSDAVFSGNGYDKLIFDRGQGSDPDLAWVRLDPQSSSAIQFAFKRSLAGNAFMWGVWADAGLRNPAMFNYNDRFTEVDAGSPEKSEKYYPIKAIYQVDNTCWPAVGFKPTGYEPHLCPSLEPQPTKYKAQPTPPSCTPWWLCIPIRTLPPPPPPIP